MTRFSVLLQSAFLCAFAFLCSCSHQDPSEFDGYVEGEFVYVASPFSGQLIELHVQRGDSVTNGCLLFRLDPKPQSSDLDQAQAQLQQSKYNLDNARKGLRPSEILEIQQRISQAKARRDLAKLEFDRNTKLVGVEAVSKDDLDKARTEYNTAEALVEQITAELTTGQLGERIDLIHALENNLSAATAAVTVAQWNLSQKSQSAPCSSVVYDTMFYAGAWVPAGQPVVSLLPPGNIKIRFFIPEPFLSTVSLNDAVAISTDGSTKTCAARISFISPEAEYTLPVIFSEKRRSKLVFMVEATPDSDSIHDLHPGLPVSVHLLLPKQP